MIRLAQAQDKRLMVVSNQDFPGDIKRVEYYRDQRLFNLVYEDDALGSDLMPCEVSDDIAQKVHKSPDVMIIMMTDKYAEPMGYQVPLVQIGI